MGGGVIYTGTARAALIGITPELMGGLQPATEPYAALLARSVRQTLGTTWGVGESGAAGPTGNRYGDPAGHSCVAVYGRHELRKTVATGSADRWPNMQAFALAALTLLGEALDLG